MIILPTASELQEQIAQSCKQKRLQLNLTQQELAQRAGVSLRTITNFELGQSIQLTSLIKLFRALGEFGRLRSLILDELPSPKSIFLQKQKGKRVRQRVKHAAR